MSPHLCVMLTAAGLSVCADELDKADGPEGEATALRNAIATTEGYELCARRHSRALQHTSAAFEIGQLRSLREDLEKRLGVVLSRLRGAA